MRPGPGFVLFWITVNKQEADRMEWSFVFFLNSVLLGVGLAMDAFSVSMANGLHDPKMNEGRHGARSRALSAFFRRQCP